MAEKTATRDAYGKALARMGRTHPEIVVLDADLSESTRTVHFAKEFPERFFQMGIAEQDMINTAAGLATCGKLPFVSTFATFGARGWEQVRNTVARCNLRVVIAFTHAGLSVGEDGASAQANEDIAIFRTVPHMKVVVPADGVETEKAIEYLVEADVSGPTYLRLGRAKCAAVFDDRHQFVLGEAATLRDGNDLTIAACGVMVGPALEAADLLRDRHGLSARVLNMSSVKPLDEETLVKAARQTGAVVTAEEHSVIGGLGGAVAELLAQKHPVPVEMVGVRDVFGESGTPDELFQKYGLTTADVVAAARRAAGRKT